MFNDGIQKTSPARLTEQGSPLLRVKEVKKEQFEEKREKLQKERSERIQSLQQKADKRLN